MQSSTERAWIIWLSCSWQATANNGRGFVILNGVGYTEDGKLVGTAQSISGRQSLLTGIGRAIFIRDPHHLVSDDQLNGGVFADLEKADWDLIEPYLKENERLFGIKDPGIADGGQCSKTSARSLS